MKTKMSILCILICLLASGCSAPDVVRNARIAVFLPNLSQGCVTQKFDASVLNAEYERQTQRMLDGIATVNSVDGTQRIVEVRAECEGDPYGQGVFGRCQYFGRTADLYLNEILAWVGERYPHATERDMAVMLANMTAHEVGHAAGLKHDARPGMVMSTEDGIRTFFEPWKWQ